MQLNSGKCSIVSYSRKKDVPRYNFFLWNALLARSKIDVNLGVTYDEKFSKHIVNIVCLANSSF